MTVINLFDKKETTTEAVEDQKTVSVKELMIEAVDSLADEGELADFITIVVNTKGELYLRSTNMSRMEAHWIMTLAADFVKGT